MQEPREPQRASLRLKGIASDGTSVHEELRGGQIVVKGAAGYTGHQAVEEEKPRVVPTGMAYLNSCCSDHVNMKCCSICLVGSCSGTLASRPLRSD